VLLALVLVAEVRNGMQLANLSGQLQNIVIGVLLLVAIVVGNLISAARTGARPARRHRRRKGVTANVRADAQVLVDSNP
jgi:ribose/xylose/arabinose/galactoside ABC-type transport system permease subunit